MFTSHAEVATDASARYAKQLASHFGHKITVETTLDGYTLTFQNFSAVLLPKDGHLLMTATAADAEALTNAQNVLGSHLERFGARNELSVQWGPAS